MGGVFSYVRIVSGLPDCLRTTEAERSKSPTTTSTHSQQWTTATTTIISSTTKTTSESTAAGEMRRNNHRGPRRARSIWDETRKENAPKTALLKAILYELQPGVCNNI